MSNSLTIETIEGSKIQFKQIILQKAVRSFYEMIIMGSLYIKDFVEHEPTFFVAVPLNYELEIGGSMEFIKGEEVAADFIEKHIKNNIQSLINNAHRTFDG